MTDRHKHSPIRFRPPEADRAWLMERADDTGRAVNAILAEALTEYRKRTEKEVANSSAAAPSRR